MLKTIIHLEPEKPIHESHIKNMNALAIDTKRTALRKKLVDTLFTNPTSFAHCVDELLTADPAQPIHIDNETFTLGNYWKPTMWGPGSKLRRSLLEIKVTLDEYKREELHQCQQSILSELHSDLQWDHFTNIQQRIADATVDVFNSDLLYLSYYKEAEMLFELCVLSYHTKYNNVIYEIYNLLYLLSEGDDEKIKLYIISKEIQIPNLLSFICSLGHQKFKYTEVAASLLEICKEWLFLGAHITSHKRIICAEKNMRLLKPWLHFPELVLAKDFKEQTKNLLLDGNCHSQTLLKTSKLFTDLIKEIDTDLSIENNEHYYDLIKKLYVCMKSMAVEDNSQRFLIYKISRHLKWIAQLIDGFELECFDRSFLQNELPQPMYVLPHLSPQSEIKITPR